MSFPRWMTTIVFAISTATCAGAVELYLAEYKFGNPLLRTMDGAGGGVQTTNLFPSADWLPVGLVVTTNKIYWTHGSFGQGAIRRANQDGSNVETLVSGLSNPRGLALDAAGGKLYWSDTQDRRIYRANLDGSGLQAIVDAGNQTGRPTLDLANGHVYYGDFATGEIRRTNLDGSNDQLVVLGGDDPNSIALDLSGGKLYWVDAQTVTNYVARANLDGTGFQVLVSFGVASSGLVDVQLDVANGSVYWADEIGATERGVWRANLDGSNATRIYTSPSGWNAGALAIVLADCQSPTQSYGAGCAGTGGFVPALTAGDCATLGGSFQIALENALGGATAFLFAGVAPGSVPMNGGCTYLLAPVLPPLFAFPLGGVGPGTGVATLHFTLPSTGVPSGTMATVQAFVQDPSGVGGGFANTQGLSITIE